MHARALSLHRRSALLQDAQQRDVVRQPAHRPALPLNAEDTQTPPSVKESMRPRHIHAISTAAATGSRKIRSHVRVVVWTCRARMRNCGTRETVIARSLNVRYAFYLLRCMPIADALDSRGDPSGADNRIYHAIFLGWLCALTSFTEQSRYTL